MKKRNPFTPEQIEEIYSIINKKGLITLKEFKDLGFSKHKFVTTFGSYNNLLYKMGKKNPFISEEKECLICLKKFTTNSNNKTQSFCSISCSNKLKKVKLGLHKDVNCLNCNKLFKNTGKKNNCCSLLCSMEFSMKNTKLSSLIRRTGANAYDLVRVRARTYSKYIHPLECKVCSYKKHYEVCHIKPIKEFDPESSTLWDVNNPDNLIHLCPNHHWELDNGIIGPPSVT